MFRLTARRWISTVPLILNGAEVTTKIVEPVFSHVSVASPLHNYSCLENLDTEIPQICQNSYTGFLEWSKKPHSERSEILRKAAEIIREKEAEFTAACEEIGSTSWFGSFNVVSAASQLEEYAKKVSDVDGVVPKSDLCDLAISIRNPIGPVYSIAPWNVPVILGCRAIAAPLAAGCSVVLKSSEKSPQVSYLLVKSFLEAGVPSSALQLIHFSPKDNVKATDLIISNKNIRKVNFTGSTAVGREIATVASKYLKPSLLELGGKNIFIVLADADLERAADSALFSAWIHKGQICMCLDKVFVHEEVYDDFVEVLKSKADEMLRNSDYHIPQRDLTSTTKINSLITDAIEKGAEVVIGSHTNDIDVKDGELPNISPVVLANLNSDMDIDTIETFGPVFSLYKYPNDDDLITELNEGGYGLKVSVWSRDVLHALKLAKTIDSGAVHINSSTVHDEATIPHGGVKDSGTGRFNSSWGIDEFSYVKTITLS